MERPVNTLTYFDIVDSEVRVAMRVGDVLLHSAMVDPIFRRELERKEVLPGDFAADDGTGLFPETVIGKLQEIGGQGAAIRILGLALNNIGSIMQTLNGDTDAVRERMIFMQDSLRREYKLSKQN